MSSLEVGHCAAILSCVPWICMWRLRSCRDIAVIFREAIVEPLGIGRNSLGDYMIAVIRSTCRSSPTYIMVNKAF